MTRYLTKRELIMINMLQIQRYSPSEQNGVKEPTELNMCVALPKQDVFCIQQFLTKQLFCIRN